MAGATWYNNYWLYRRGIEDMCVFMDTGNVDWLFGTQMAQESLENK